jgi:hypothetical protein
MTTPELASYIQKQLQSGSDANTIATQLRTAGWSEPDIQQGFTQAQHALTPTPIIQPAAPVATTLAQQLPPPLQQSRIKTGGMLFKQSLAIIKTNPGLSRYVIISAIWTIAGLLALAIIFVVDYLHSQLLSTPAVDQNGSSTVLPTLFGYIVLIIWGLAQTIITHFYSTGLSVHLLSIFRGQPTTYPESLLIARKKLLAIITFSVISLVVGYIIRLLERIRIAGWIMAQLIGAVWALATAFTIPLIADKDISGVQATKQSILLFKQTWGQTLVSRIALGGTFFLLYYLIVIPGGIILALGLSFLLGWAGLIVALFLMLTCIVIASLIQTLATYVLNVALYYYATYKIIPPNFSGELLASVFTPKKKKKQLITGV